MTASARATGLGVRFQFDRDRRVVTPTLARLRRRGAEAWGLRDVTFATGRGEAIALLGRSGAGKTTLLRVLAGVLVPDEGSVETRGRVASLLSVGAGLMATLTGRENASLLLVLAGLPRRSALSRLDDVRDRSGLGEAFERPVSSYSQGMRARLGFAAADEAQPDVLLLDEVHEALDHEYRDVVEHRATELIASGGIVVAAGHDHPLLERICTRALWMERGRVVEDGPFGDLQRRYLAATTSREALA
jgi:ABC-type polysaccharide/polyol phosphate transport system ATPase subunit